MRLALALLFVLSGFSALIYELIWTRQLSLVFGATAIAEAAVLAAYMGGLGIGAWTMSVTIHRVHRPLRLYALLELGIGLSALAVRPLLEVARQLYVELGPMPGEAGTALFYWACTMIILALPTGFMGATLSLLVKHWAGGSERMGRGVAVLYLANTLGAAGGTLSAGFVLIPRFGLGQTLAIAVALNLLIAAVAGCMDWSGRADAKERTDSVGTTGASGPWIAPDSSKTEPHRRGFSRMYLAVAMSGLVGMAYEVFWSRALTPALGGSLFAFSTMLAAFLIGISLGSTLAAAARWSRRSSWIGVGLAQAGLAGFALAGLWALDSGWAGQWIRAAPLSASSVVLAAAVLMPGAVLLGFTFPLAVRAVSDSGRDEPANSGRVYAWNTAGTVVGAVACGFWLLPTLGFDGTAALLAALALVSAALAWSGAGGRGPRFGAILALAAAGLAWTAPPPVPWALLGQSIMGNKLRPEQVAFLGVGRSSTVVAQRAGDEYRLTTNGLPESSIQSPGSRVSRYAIARWLALLPSATRSEAQNALVIGFGAGITAQSFPQRIQRVEVAELEPEVIAANRALASRRMSDPLADPRLHLWINDARNLLTTRETRYDVIVSQPSHPWTAGASNLFTREFFRLVDSRLKDGPESGVFLQWIGLRFVDQDLLASLVATLRDTFQYVEAYRPPPMGAALLLASQSPLNLSGALAESWATDAESWAAAGVRLPDDVLLAQWLDDEDTEQLASGAPIATDYRNLMATRAPWLLKHRRHRVPQTLAASDPVADLQRHSADLYPLRRLLHVKSFARARQALAAAPEPLRPVATGLWDLARENKLQGLRRLREQLQAESKQARLEAAAALLSHHGAGPSGIPSDVVAALSEHGPLRATYSAWRGLRLQDLETVSGLDEELAAIGARHPIFTMALRLRVLWRFRSQDGAAAREALDLIQSAGDLEAGPQALMLRAELAERADDRPVLWASLAELARKFETNERSVPPVIRAKILELRQQPELQGEPWASLWSSYEDLGAER